ncbi:MAG: S8 family serine peptidase, partial [Anaerolineae bacterium]
MFKKRISLLVVGVLLALLAWSAASAAPPVEGEAGPGGPLLRLAYATFDPAQGEPAMPAQLHRAAYPNDEAGPYIIQFWGPIEPAWRAAIVEQGAQVESYLPDYALLVRLEGDAPAQLKRLPFVRWVGLFQPAYKMNPGLAPSRTGLYRLRLARRAGTAQVRRALAPLVGGVSGGGTSLVVQASFEQLPHIARLPDVLWIEEFRLFEPLNDKAAGVMNLSTPWNAGYTGAGQTVTIADTGLDTGVDTAAADDIHRDFDNRVTHISSWPVAPEPGCIANAGDNDGPSDVDTGHGTHVAGSVAGNGARSGGAFKGPAYQASITFQAVEQYTTWTGSCAAQYSSGYYLTGLPADLTTFFQEAYNWGSRIHTNSWGSSVAGAYTTSAQQVDQFAWDNKDLTILFAAGNSGEDADSNGYVDEDSIGSPGTAKNAITVGATDNNRPASGASSTWGAAFGFPAPPTSSDALSDDPGELAAFSSRGPTDDGRIKPDVVAPGTNILSTRSSLISGNGWFAYNNYYMFNGGTSMATPLTAGAAAVVRDYLVDGEGLPTPGAALIKALLINTAVDIGGYGNSNQEAGQPIPNNHEGWGRVDVAAATDSANRHLVDGRLLANGNTHTFNFTVTNTAVPLKVTLAWTDYPGDPAAGAQLVNDLNLKVTSPGASVYRGNHFSGGWSATGGAADSANNVENVFVQSPAAGVWSIEVSGSSVSQGPQPYALVIGGAGNLGDPLAASDTPPTLTVPPNQSAPEGVGSNNAVDLWSYATDSEEDFNALAFSISNSPAAQAGV